MSKMNDAMIDVMNMEKVFQLCFDAYKHRLEDEWNVLGKKEYDRSSKLIISRLQLHSPTKYSLSVTTDPSLHYTIRFGRDMSLFIEIFLDKNEHETFIQLYCEDKSLFSSNCSLMEGLDEVDSILSANYE